MKTLSVLLFLALSLHAFALDVNESLPNVRILAVHPSNVVVLNRGMEDGIAVGTHAKLRAAEGYAARALCVKAGMLTSHWRLYRVVESQLVSKDLTYRLIGMDMSEAPGTVEKWSEVDHDKLVPDFDEKKLLPPAEVKSDLPDNLEKDEKLLAPKSAGAQIIENVYDPALLKRDLKSFNGSLFASPWSIQRGGDTDVQNLRYGGKLANNGEKYMLGVGFERTSLKARENGSGEKVLNESTVAQGTFTVKRLTPVWDGFADVTYRQARYGEFQTPKRHLLIAPVGFLRHFEPGKTLKEVSASYAPTYDTRVHEDEESDGESVERTHDGLRHALGLFMKFQFTPDFSLSSDFHWRPHQSFTTWGIDLSDNLAQERLTASFRVVGKLFVDLEYQWLDDAQLRRLNRLPRVVTTQSVNVRYDFGL